MVKSTVPNAFTTSLMSGSFIGLALMLSLAGCQKNNDSQPESAASTVSSLKPSSGSVKGMGGASSVLVSACLKKAEQGAISRGDLPKGVTCSTTFIANPEDNQTRQRICTDAIPKECGVDSTTAQEAMSKNFPILEGKSVTAFQKCMHSGETSLKEKGLMPSRLSCGQPVVGYEDQKLLSQICTDTLVDLCRSSLPAELREIDKATENYVQGSSKTDGLVRAEPIADNPKCAANPLHKMNADCSQVTVQNVTWQLTPFQMCIDRKNIEIRATVKSPSGSSTWYCGRPVIREDEMQFQEKQCDDITNACQKEIPDYKSQQMKRIN